jgi:diadenosine tetraphosphate (Ap4A) HIT family hydrolase
MTPFEIHPQLLGDCHRLGKLSFCHVLLHKNGTASGDFFELASEQQQSELAEVALLSACVKRSLGCAKINFAAIGNVVPQLHLHVVGRKVGDACWPAPVWGHLTAERGYSSAELAHIIHMLSRDVNLLPGRAG